MNRNKNRKEWEKRIATYKSSGLTASHWCEINELSYYAILDAFSAWLKTKSKQVLPKSALGKAIAYYRNQWTKLEAFLLDGRLELINNRGERAIKPFVIGRKNWLFSNTQKGATASAIIYSVIETAKANGLSPFHYLTYLFEQLPNIDTRKKENLDALLPWSKILPDSCRKPQKQ